jgi:hypothetical protein
MSEQVAGKAMRLILEKDGVKREIRAPFRLCLSREDANVLIAQLMDKPTNYGWVTIHGEVLVGDPDTTPRRWTE